MLYPIQVSFIIASAAVFARSSASPTSQENETGRPVLRQIRIPVPSPEAISANLKGMLNDGIDKLSTTGRSIVENIFPVQVAPMATADSIETATVSHENDLNQSKARSFQSAAVKTSTTDVSEFADSPLQNLSDSGPSPGPEAMIRDIAIKFNIPYDELSNKFHDGVRVIFSTFFEPMVSFMSMVENMVPPDNCLLLNTCAYGSNMPLLKSLTMKIPSPLIEKTRLINAMIKGANNPKSCPELYACKAGSDQSKSLVSQSGFAAREVSKTN